MSPPPGDQRDEHTPTWRVVVLSHHKCATVWQQEVLAYVCRANGLSFHHSHLGSALPSPDHHVTLLTNPQYPRIAPTLGAGTRCLHVVRNPMSIVVSAYFSHLRSHPLDGWPALARQRQVLAQHDEPTGMLLTLAFLESLNFDEHPGPLHALHEWDHDDPRIETMRMEDVTETPEILLAALQDAAGGTLTLPPPGIFAFERLTGRKVGQADPEAHLRSGDLVEWRTRLPAAAAAYLRAHYADFLRRYYPEAL